MQPGKACVLVIFSPPLQSYQFLGQTPPAAQGLNGFWNESECARNFRILKDEKNSYSILIKK